MQRTEVLQVVVSSGQVHQIERITLYDRSKVASIAATLGEANQKLGGVSTGLGFLGSPGWVIGGAVLLGALEGAVSRSTSKEGMQLLSKAYAMSLELHSTGRRFPVVDIVNIRTPNPKYWTAVNREEKEFDLSTMGLVERMKFITQHNVPRDAISGGKTKVVTDVDYVHDGDEFIAVEGEGKTVSIRWSQITEYQFL